MKVVIPAAGLGTRFAASNFGIPKELLPLGGTPLIGHALAEAAIAGFETAVVVVSPVKHQLRQFLLNSELPLPVEVVIQSEPLGIGEAVLRCWEGEPIAVLLPDDVVVGAEHWTTLADLHRRDGAATLCIRPVPIETTSRFGIAECDGNRVVGLIEKPPKGTTSSNLAIFGRYVVTEAVVSGLRSFRVAGELQLTYGFAAALTEDPGVRAVLFEGDIFDCGTPIDYAESSSRFPG